MALIRRGDLNRPLTIEELDSNFDYLEELSSLSVQSVTGIPVDRTDPLNPVILDSRGYKSYTAILNIVDGGNTITPTVLENTIGANIIFYLDENTYIISTQMSIFSEIFPSDKTFTSVSKEEPGYVKCIRRYDANVISLYNLDISNNIILQDSVIFIEIRVYN
jgi:hypothetical protein